MRNNNSFEMTCPCCCSTICLHGLPGPGNGPNPERLITEIMNLLYPVGSIYMSAGDENPEDLFGGLWEPWGEGRVPVGAGSNGESFYALGEMGGAESNTYTVDSTGTAAGVGGPISVSGSVSVTGSTTLIQSNIPEFILRMPHVPYSNSGTLQDQRELDETGNPPGRSKKVWINLETPAINQASGQSSTYNHDAYHIGYGSPSAVSVASSGSNTLSGTASGLSGAVSVSGDVSPSTVQPYEVCHMWKRLALAPLS